MAVMVGTIIYKLTSLLIGFGLVYLGYKLFLAGIFEGGGDLNATFSDNKLTLKKASPGIFFALFGTIVIAMALWKGQELEQNTEIPSNVLIAQSGEDEIALDTLKKIFSGNQEADSITEFEENVINSFFEKMEKRKTAKLFSASRGVASVRK
jgi:hypothetical protein